MSFRCVFEFPRFDFAAIPSHFPGSQCLFGTKINGLRRPVYDATIRWFCFQGHATFRIHSKKTAADDLSTSAPQPSDSTPPNRLNWLQLVSVPPPIEFAAFPLPVFHGFLLLYRAHYQFPFL